MRNAFTLMGVALALWLTACGKSGPELGSSLNFAAAFGWGGYVDTDLSFSEFFDEDHTLVARFMPQHPRAYAGPILAENGTGTFFVGQQSHTKTNSRLVMAIGDQQQDYEAFLAANTWHHLAVVRSGNTFRLYLDGQHLGPDVVIDSTTTQLPGGSAKLRLARRTSGKTLSFDGSNRVPQFYGLIDDVAVFDRALSAAAIQTLLADYPRLNETLLGPQWGLTAAWTFDSKTPSGGTLAAAFDRPASFHSPAEDGASYEGVGDLLPAQKVPASQLRDSAVDAKFLLPPFHQNTYYLPFMQGQIWEVWYGNSTLNSHYGYAAFAWDFRLGSTSVNTAHENAQPTSCDQPLYAVTAGAISATEDDLYEAEFKDGKNYLRISAAPAEEVSYLHLRTSSVADAGLEAGDQVQSGQLVARVGTRKADNCHLHFGSRSDTVTIPLAFSDYEASDDNGQTWHHVARGVPQHGQWVRRTGENTGPSIKITQPADGASVWYGGLGEPFAAEVSDLEDGDSCCPVSWSSDQDGFLGTGKHITVGLSVGTHVITAKTQDSHGAVATDSITMTAVNVAPTVLITAPKQGATLASNKTWLFQAAGHDVNEPGNALCNSIVWSSSVPGDPMLAGCEPQVAFATLGQRTWTVTATDALGAQGSAQVTIDVTQGPELWVTITQPTAESGFLPTDDIELAGTISQAFELPATYRWSVSTDQVNYTSIASGDIQTSGGGSKIVPQQTWQAGWGYEGQVVYLSLVVEAQNGTVATVVQITIIPIPK